MKKFEKVLFVFALLAMVIMPLSAAKTMKVSWQWLLNDPDVTAYRYQLNAEDADGWTVVDGNTDTFTAKGLDPYADYTLYLQCSYDGENWSETASSTAFAMLTVEEVAPVAVVAEEAAPAAEVAVGEAAPAEEPKTEVVVEAPAAPEAAPVAVPYAFSIYGYGVQGEYSEGSFSSTTAQKGLVTAEEIQGFLAYESNKYGAILSGVYFNVVEDGFTLQYPAGIDASDYIGQYKADLEEYITALFAPKAEEVVVVAAPTEEAPAVVVPVENYHFSVYGYGVSSTFTPCVFSSSSDVKGMLTAEDILGFIAYENGKYGDLLSSVIFTLDADGFTLTLPEGIAAGDYIAQYEADLNEYIGTLFAPVSVVVEAPAEPVAPVVVEAPVEAPAETPAVAETPLVPGPVEDVHFIEVPVEPVEDAPAALKVKYNKFHFVTGLTGGVTADVINNGVENYFARASYRVELKNIIKLGSRLGVGLRLDADAVAKPASGWNAALDDPKALLDLNAWDLSYAGEAKLMTYLNFKGASLYLGAGAGYDNVKTLDDVKTFDKANLYVGGVAGMSIDLSKHTTLALDLGYNYYLESKDQKANASVGILLAF